MEEEINETVAQLQHENKKLQEELDHIKENALSMEENFNLVCVTLTERENFIRSLDQNFIFLRQSLLEKDNLIELLESKNSKIQETNNQLECEQKLMSKEMEILKNKEEELKTAHDEVLQENRRLLSELSMKSKEYRLTISTIEDLSHQIKELEEEKAVLSIGFNALLRDQEETEASKDTEDVISSQHWSEPNFRVNRFDPGDQFLTSTPYVNSKEEVSNLREEILEAQLKQKQLLVVQLEKMLKKKEENESELNILLRNLKEKLRIAGLLKNDPRIDLKLDSSTFCDIYNLLMRLIQWPEDQTGECKPLKEVSSLAVLVKDGIQTTQPGAVRIVETISIASQTDPIKYLSPVLPFKGIQGGVIPIQHYSLSESDDEGHPLPLIGDRNIKMGLQLFSEHRKNCDLDMDIYRMSKSRKTGFTGMGIERRDDESHLHSSESFSASDRESNKGRDVNLNIKNFTGFNRRRTLKENGEVTKEGSAKLENPETGAKRKIGEGKVEEERDFIQDESNSECGSLIQSKQSKIRLSSSSSSSSPASENAADIFNKERENIHQTYMAAKSILSYNPSLTVEELATKFQDLSFAFKTDSITIQKRLQILKRRRDQAESNIENQLKIINAKFKSLQYSGVVDSDYLNLISDLKKQLDFVLNATLDLAGSAEGYGYVRHEEKTLEIVSVMLQHVENVKNEKAKILDKLKIEGKRSQPTLSLDNDADEERMLRRRSAASVAMEGPSRRRASIATLPRISSTVLEAGGNGKGVQWISSSRGPGGLAKKLTFSQTSSPRVLGNNFTEGEETRRDSISCRQRMESRSNESPMKDIEEFPEQRRSPTPESESFDRIVDSDGNVETNDSDSPLKRFFDSVKVVRRDSAQRESVDVTYCLKKIIEWNKLVISATRFRRPCNVWDYVPFYITWYVILVLASVFICGVLIGVRGCYGYSSLKYAPAWFIVLAWCIVVRRYRFLVSILLNVTLAVIVSLIFLVPIIFANLTEKERDSLLRAVGLVVEVRYHNGPPPI